MIVDQRLHYPWELICDSTSDQTKPLVYASGLVRQMSTNMYRAQIQIFQARQCPCDWQSKTHGAYLDLQGAKKRRSW
ncbi:MAG: hypothetical protein IPH96_18035 [Saprospiraceae bacterium]|nr:hypothetical protein [Saprospiraceae bacterium]